MEERRPHWLEPVDDTATLLEEQQAALMEQNKESGEEEEGGPEARARYFAIVRGIDPDRLFDDEDETENLLESAAGSDLSGDQGEPARARVALMREIQALLKADTPAGAPIIAIEDDLTESLLGSSELPPTNRWIPIGPAGVIRGQAGNSPTVSGRASGIAMTANGERVYIASANGGVWRTLDQGGYWEPLMQRFDLNPELSKADSLTCGAIALVPGGSMGQDRIYVGSGEAASRKFLGIGPVVSFDGGKNWVTEDVVSGPELFGAMFYELAVNPTDPEIVYGATSVGLYRRRPAVHPETGQQIGQWEAVTKARRITAAVSNPEGICFFASWGGNISIYDPVTGNISSLPIRLPISEGARAGRTRLALAPSNPNILYVFMSDRNGSFYALFRVDLNDLSWRRLEGVPATVLRNGQGNYDMAIAISPEDENLIILGGDTVNQETINGRQRRFNWSAALYRIKLDPSNDFRVESVYMGRTCHPDVHNVAFVPNDPEQLWVCCDGGMFYTDKAIRGRSDFFDAKNDGLATMTMNYIGQHPTDSEIIFCGTQDNGGQRTHGGRAWLHASSGDSGYFVVNWADPKLVLDTYIYANIRRSRYGGNGLTFNERFRVPTRALFYAPLIGTPYNPAHPHEAERVAFGGTALYLSDDFGENWYSIPSGNFPDDEIGYIKSITFANYQTVYAGTTSGKVVRYQFDENQDAWTQTDLGFDSIGLTLTTITAIAVDPSDLSGSSIYVTLAGTGEYTRLWFYDGRSWQARGGVSDHLSQTLLQKVNHTAIAVDPLFPDHLYVGTDIGVWRSLDAGFSWEMYSYGLPDASVIDMQIHAPSRLLRVSTHGRGMFELSLDRAQRGIDLYVRDGNGRLPYFSDSAAETKEVISPDIKLSSILRWNSQFQAPQSFTEFEQRYEEHYLGINPTHSVTNSVSIQVQNRGQAVADQVRVTGLLVRLVDHGLPPMPRGFDESIQRGTPINSAYWRTLSTQVIDNVRPNHPQVVSFEFSSDHFAYEENLDFQLDTRMPSYGIVAAIHHEEDRFSSLASVDGRRNGKLALNTFGRWVVPKSILPADAPEREEIQFPEIYQGVHTVTTGDTLEAIARQFFRVEDMAEAILEANRDILTDEGRVLTAGTELRIPASLRALFEAWGRLPQRSPYLAQHTVVAGNTLSGIAYRYYGSGTREKWMVIYEANRGLIGPDPWLLQPGMVLTIPFVEMG